MLKPLESFAEALRLGNAMGVRHGSLVPARFETWRGKMRSSTPDHILIVGMGTEERQGHEDWSAARGRTE